MANILPAAAPTTFRTWKTCPGKKEIDMSKRCALRNAGQSNNRHQIKESALSRQWLPFRSHPSPGRAAARSTPVGCSLCPDWRCPRISRSSRSHPCCCSETCSTFYYARASLVIKISQKSSFKNLQLNALLHEISDLTLGEKEENKTKLWRIFLHFCHEQNPQQPWCKW